MTTDLDQLEALARDSDFSDMVFIGPETILDLIARVRQAEADTKRLDWLEQFFAIDDVGDESYVPGWFVHFEALQEKLTWFSPIKGVAENSAKTNKTLRAAINAATENNL